MISVWSEGGEGEVGEVGVGGGEGGCFRFTMAISQCGDDSLSQVTEGRTWRG